VAGSANRLAGWVRRSGKTTLAESLGPSVSTTSTVICPSSRTWLATRRCSTGMPETRCVFDEIHNCVIRTTAEDRCGQLSPHQDSGDRVLDTGGEPEVPRHPYGQKAAGSPDAGDMEPSSRPSKERCHGVCSKAACRRRCSPRRRRRRSTASGWTPSLRAISSACSDSGTSTGSTRSRIRPAPERRPIPGHEGATALGIARRPSRATCAHSTSRMR